MLDGESAFRKWKNVLSDKFRNMRKRRDKNVPEILARKRHVASNGSTTLSKTQKTSNQWGLKNFLPERPSTEDNTSIKKAKEWMQLEFTKRRPDMSGVRLRMDLTFPDRRKDIVLQHCPVEDIKMNYPCLFVEEEILNEFTRISEIDVDKSFLSGLMKYGHTILKIAPEGNRDKKRVMETISGSRIESDRNRLTAYGCLLMLPTLLKENLCDILCDKESKPETVNPLLTYAGDLLSTADF